ncbi:MAG: hypothetical protein IPK19_25825 [Chloroflexi bacterium]|nr:hypothetical protein [Chloroflexota bacterium]
MITVHRSTEAGLEIVERPMKGCWIEVTNPTPDEVRSLPQALSIPPDFIAASLSRDEISRIENEDNALLILTRIPHFQSAAASIPYMTQPMGIIVTDEWVITICRHEHKLLHDLPHEHQVNLSTDKPSRFVLHLLWSVANNYILHLRQIDEASKGLRINSNARFKIEKCWNFSVIRRAWFTSPLPCGRMKPCRNGCTGVNL